jgi:hypothetical protein
MMKQDEGTDNCHWGEDMELMLLLLPANQFYILQEEAGRQNLTATELIRRSLRDFLRQLAP